ncbi:family 20 glycosylhydrolase [Pedobacter sp. AW31-3R]|uniref:family 20 glycosylhydrolase n=1 Tax=Pedobacter sp. AW31-3R TaxID=3445781 RepID=UPI003FA07EC8
MRQPSYKKIISLALLLGIGSICGVNAQQVAARDSHAQLALIPYPTELAMGKGSFLLGPATVIITENHLFDNEAAQLNLLLEQYLGKRLKVNSGKSVKSGKDKAKAIILRYNAAIAAPEGYELSIDAGEVVLSAKEAAGMFRGVETIRQLLPADEHSKTFAEKLSLPALKIADHPAYAWRGMHLDVSRHFFSISYLKKFIDLLALYKFNKFHLHLTDDQGWRIEIKKYPKLTEEGAWRTFNNQDSACMVKAKDNPDFIIDPKHIQVKDGKTLYGGFYTQEEMKGIVAYALERHIDIIPEVDMPGHMMAAINSYPFLTCNGENKWGKLFTTPICPCNEATFEFAENIFTEIMDIFPSKFIHVGGDEVDRSSWEKSEECKAFMLKNNLKTSAELQSYFINRMEKFFNSKNRKLIGWDEILEDGVSSTAMVMYWRSWVPDAPVKAAKNGNQVVMSPGNPLYFDNDPDQNSIDNVYHFNPVPAGLTAVEGKGIIGAQANTWTERIPTEARADYMIFPRMTALAERLWSDKDQYESYLKRLNVHYRRLDALKVSYRLPDFSGLAEYNVFVDQVILNPVKPLLNTTIRYTTDGSLPSATSSLLGQPLTIKEAVFIRMATFTPEGRRGTVYDLHYKQQAMAAPVELAAVKAGLTCDYFPGEYKSSKLMGDNPETTFVVNNVVVPVKANAPSFGLKYSGYLDIPEDGIYSFYLTCDDGGILKIAGNEVVNNDGWHGPFEKSGQAALKKGLQPIALNFVEGGGGYTLKLKYSINGAALAEVPASWLKH